PVQDAVTRAIHAVRHGLHEATLTGAIEARDEAQVLLQLDWQGQATPILAAALEPELTRLLGEAGETAERDLVHQLAELTPEQQALGAELKFDLLSPRAVAWVQRQAGTLIKEISDGQQQAIRDLLTRSWTEGMPPAATARLLRQVVGLTTRQAQAVMNYRQRLLSDGTDPATVERL